MQSLYTENLELRQFTEIDIPQFVAAARESANSVGIWMPWWTESYSEEAAKIWFAKCKAAIEDQSGYDLGVFFRESGEFVGGIAINRIDEENRIGNIGYWVRESQQNKGYCSLAVARIAEFGFSSLNLARLEIVILAENIGSRRVAEKCGAYLECIAKNRLFHKGVSMPAAVYSLVAK